MIFLVVLEGCPPEQNASVSVSVWVQAADSSTARQHALDTLTSEGFVIDHVESTVETTAADYFRPCASRDAFERAQREGIAWRVAGTD